jgi:hypothetical protein
VGQAGSGSIDTGGMSGKSTDEKAREKIGGLPSCGSASECGVENIADHMDHLKKNSEETVREWQPA